MPRENLLAQTFVELADSLVDDFDVIDLLTVLVERVVDLLDVDAAGILLADADGQLRVMAASNEQTRLIELFQLQNEEGACLEAFSTGQQVLHGELRSAGERWPQFAAEAVESGFESVFAFPLHLRAVVIGALNLFRSTPGELPKPDVLLAQALADVASIAILQDQAVRASQVQVGQLQNALDRRVTVEQAKGMLAERGRIEMDEAFTLLRSYARSNNRQLTAVAHEIIAGQLALDAVVNIAPARRPR